MSQTAMTLHVNTLAGERGGRVVFDNVSFTLACGESLMLTGPNGSGKTSLLRVLCGLGDIADGTVAVDGMDNELTLGQRAHYVAHANAVKPVLTVVENLCFWRDFLGGGDVDAALDAFGLTHLARFSTALLSAGQQRRLSLARLRLVPRPLWLLDEPTVGLDAASQERLVRYIQEHLAMGGLLIAASHTALGLEFTHRLDMAHHARPS